MSNIISLEFYALDIYSLAVYNNSIPLIDEIIVKNDSDYILKNLDVEISSSPSIFSTFVTKVPVLSSGRYIIFDKPALEFDVTKIMYSSQPVVSVVNIKVKHSGEILADSSKNIVLLPYDYISPISNYTELISSFVSPEQDEVKKISSKIPDKLKSNSSIQANSDMWDFKNKNITRALMKAIYEVVCDLKITFDTFNASLESRAMQIKLPETVISACCGNGLEIALLTASIAECIGLNPFIVFTGEKILVGLFYLSDCFDTSVSDDGRAFVGMKDGSNEKFCIIDTTSMISGTQVRFEDSLITAQKAINACDYPIAVDIHRSRLNGYIPLPARFKQNGNLIFETAFIQKRLLNYFNSAPLKSLRSFSDYVKSGIQSEDSNALLTSADISDSIYVIGSPDYILKKLFINGKIALKSIPFSNIVGEGDLLPQISKLNVSANLQDMSDSVNTLYEKENLNRRMIKILNEGKKEFSEICLCLGTVRYKYNGFTRFAPLMYIPINFEADSVNGVSVKLSNFDACVNSSIVGILGQSGISIDCSQNNDSVIDWYKNISENMSDSFSDNGVFEFFDTTFISVYNIHCHALSEISTPEYFEKSNIIKDLIENKTIVSNLSENEFSLNECDLPFSLDSSQIKAVQMIGNNTCTVVKGANCSGKTRVAATVAFNELKNRHKVLYLTNSEGNMRDFLQLAEHAHFDEFVMKLPDKTNTVNTFEAYFGNESDKTFDELSGITEQITSSVCRQNAYYENLHKVNEIGFSLYEAASQYERYRTFPYSVNFTNDEISKLSRDDVVAWFDTVSSVSKAGADCKEPYMNPLSYIREKNFSYDLKSRAAIALSSHFDLSQRFINKQNELTQYLGIEISVMSEKQTRILIKILEALQNDVELIYHGIFGRSTIDSDFSRIEALVLKCDDLFELKSFISSHFSDDITALDFDSLLVEWRNANSKFAFSRTSAQNAVKNKIKSYCYNSKFITNDNFSDILSKLSRYKSSLEYALENATLVYQTTGINLKEMINSDKIDVFDRIQKSIEKSREYLSLISELYDSEQSPDTVYLHQSNLFKNSSKLKADINYFFGDFTDLFAEYSSSEKALVSLLNIDIEKAKEDNNKLWYYFVTQFITRMIDSIDLLKYWCNWNIEKEKAVNLGLENVIKLYEDEKLTSNDIKNAFLKGFFKSVTEYFLSCDDNVGSYSTKIHQSEVGNIRLMLENYRKQLYSSLKQEITNEYSEFVKNKMKIPFDEALTLLKNEFGFNLSSRASSECVELLQNAKPCFVASSPNFVSKFKNRPCFDTVIIDNTCEQMQHSLFMLLPLAKKVVIFETDTGGERINFAKFFTDAGAPVSSLNWMYGINFTNVLANEIFYNNSLSRFITSKIQKNGVTVIRQLGTYDRKSARVNVMEASTVVDEIFKIKSEKPHLSIGVYAMTDEQKTLIEMLYYKRVSAFKNNANLKNDEHLFFRNFNQCEYDLRDVILFSSVFAVEEKPKYKDTITKTIAELSSPSCVTNFIHLLTSARKSFVLVTSLTEENLKNLKTTEKNYCIFKKIICRLLSDSYLISQDLVLGKDSDNSIVRQVANHIESMGYKVDLNLGNNRCKIDIAVRKKDKSNYLLGIVFDETVYINGDGFYGRDLILNSLENLCNWKILRVYTVEWFENYTKQLDMITHALSGDDFDNNFSISQFAE